MKKVFCILAAVLLFCAMMPAATAQEAATLRLQGGAGKVGDTVKVDILTENAPDCTAYELIFTYDDTVLRPVSEQNEDAKGIHKIHLEHSYQGEPAVKAVGVDTSFCFRGNTRLASVTFEIIGETEGLYGSPLTVRYATFTKDQEGMQTGQIFGPTRKGGRVYVGADREVTTAEAVEILRHLIGIPSENAAYLDWNGDGSVSVADAVLLLRELN